MSLFKSLLKITTDVADIALTPVKIAADVASVAIAPVAKITRDVADEVEKTANEFIKDIED